MAKLTDDVLSHVAKWWTAAVSVKYVYESLTDVGYSNTGCAEFRRGIQKCKVNTCIFHK